MTMSLSEFMYYFLSTHIYTDNIISLLQTRPRVEQVVYFVLSK